MSMENKNETSIGVEQTEYNKKLHKIGTMTMGVLLVLTFLPTVYVCVAKGGFPGWKTLTAAALAIVGEETASWIIQPVLYFPMIGIAGAYICFTAGNITNMRIPAALAAQNAVNAEPGSHKAEAASVFAMAASVVVNFFFLAIVILFGSYLLSILPENIKAAFDYAIPAVYGAVVITMAKTLKGGK